MSKKLTSSKNNLNWEILVDIVPWRYEIDETRPNPTKKLPNQSIRGQINFKNQLQTFPLPCNTRKLRHKTWPTDEKNSFRQMTKLHLPIQRSKNEAVSNLFHLCLKKNWAPGPRHVYISKSSSFFYSSQARNTLPTPTEWPTSTWINRLHSYHSKHNCYCRQNRTSKGSWHKKTCKTD